MGLFNKKIETLPILEDSRIVYSPITGILVPLEDVDDKVFANKMMGDGIAIKPDQGMVYAPISGKVISLFPTGHAIGIEGNNGVRVIIHIGIDTIELKGKGFKLRVKKNDVVKAGQLIIEFDLRYIANQKDPITMVCIENSNEFRLTKSKKNQIKAGEVLLKLFSSGEET